MGTMLYEFSIGELTDSEFERLRNHETEVLERLAGNLRHYYEQILPRNFSFYTPEDKDRFRLFRQTALSDHWETLFEQLFDENYFLVSYYPGSGGQDFLALKKNGEVWYSDNNLLRETWQ